MKTRIDILTIVILFTVSLMLFFPLSSRFHNTFAEPIDRYNTGWIRIEDSAAEDAADFATTIDLAGDEGVWASKTSEAYRITTYSTNIGSRVNLGISAGTKWMFAFYGTDAADETFSFDLVGWAAENGMAQIMCEGNGILGTQDVVTEPNGDAITNGLWADTIAIDEQTKWPSYDGALGDPGTSIFNSGDNEVALLVVDLAGIEWIDFVTYDVAGGAEASTLGVYGRRY